MNKRDTILTINVVEPQLVRAVKMLSKDMKQELKGLVLVNKEYAGYLQRPKDTTGLFTEVVCDFDNKDELQAALKPYMNRILAATYRYESAVQPFRQVVPFLPYVPTPSESSLLWSTEKPLMRDRLKAYNDKLVPKYQYLEENDLPEVRDIIEGFTFPVIVKPGGLAESLLVSRCENMEQMVSCLHNTFKVIQDVYNREHRRSKPGVLVEEMMQGDMFSTDAYVTRDGEIFCLPLVKVITAHSIGLPGFYSYRHIIPTGLPKSEIEAAFAVSRDALRALNLSSTTAHVELFQTPQGWKIIEVGARIGGYREPLYKEAYGVEHFYNDLLVRMGSKPIMPSEPIKHAAGINIYADKEGYIESIGGLEEARKLSSIVYLDAHAMPGDLALFADKGGQLIVDGILSNKNQEQLEKDVARVRELVKIKIRPVSMNRPVERLVQQPHAAVSG